MNIAILLTGVCLAAAATLFIVMSQKGLLTPEIEIKDGQAPLALPDFVEDSGILYPVIRDVRLTADDTMASIILRNPEGNTCYLTFEIILAETGESLYLSELVAPSAYIEEQKLARGFTEGRYEAELVIRVYDPLSYTEQRIKTVPFELDVTASTDPH